MAIPDYQTLMLPLLRLAAEGGERRVPDISGQIADEFALTSAEREEMLPSGRQSTLHNRLHWAKFYMTKAGLIASPTRGRFVATETGKQVLSTNPSRIDITLLMRQPAFRDFHTRSDAEVCAVEPPVLSALKTLDEVLTPDARIEAAYVELHAALRADLLDRIAGNSPLFFERLIVAGPHRAVRGLC